MSLYKQTVPVFIRSLNNMAAILTKAEKWCDEKGKKHEEILQFRLIEDMRPLTYQVQSLSNTSKFLAVRVGHIENEYLADEETTFAQLHERIKKTISILESIDATKFNEAEDKPIRMETRSMGNYRFETGQTYVSDYAIPNFHFHMTSAYCILRHLGVPIGALDYLGNVFHKVE